MRTWILILGFAFATTSFAQSGDKAKARAYFSDGQKLYKQKKYKAAQKKFQAAHRTLPLKAFLFNIGQCKFQNGDYQGAAKNYREYLVENEEAPNYDLVQQYILEANARHEAQVAKREADGLKKKADEAEKKAKEAAFMAKNAKSLIGAAKGEAEAAEREAKEARRLAKDAEKKRMAADVERKKLEDERIEAEKRYEEERNSLTAQPWFWTSIGGTAIVLVVAVVGTVAAVGGYALWSANQSNGSVGEKGAEAPFWGLFGSAPVDTRGGEES